VDKVRTVSDSKRDFYSYHTRPINSVYRRVVEELLVEMHLLSINVDFRYDPIYALGVFTSFERFMEGYRPEQDRESIFDGLCRALHGSAEQYRSDAGAVLIGAKETSIEDIISRLKDGGDDSGSKLIQSLKAVKNNPKFKYSRLFVIGLYTLLAESKPSILKDKDDREATVKQICEALNLLADKVGKDLDIYRGNLDKMQQLLKVLEDVLEADKKKRLQKEQEKQAAG
jgi:photosystem II biogenesis protein Psp29